MSNSTGNFSQPVAEDLRSRPKWPTGMSLWGLDAMDGVLDSQYLMPQASSRTPVTVYVLDSGTALTHPDLQPGQMELIYTSRNVADKTTTDCTGHGSHVAGIIVGEVVGVAKRARLKMLRMSGCKSTFSNENVIEVLEYLRPRVQRPAVVNLSLLPLSSASLNVTRLNQLLVEFVQSARVPVVVAAGDDASKSCHPISKIDGLISVGAHDENFRQVSSSNHGPCTNIFAPGMNIWVGTLYC